MPFHFNIGGIGQQQADTLASGKGGNILAQGGRLAQRLVVQLEVAGMHDLPHRGIHQQRVPLGME